MHSYKSPTTSINREACGPIPWIQACFPRVANTRTSSSLLFVDVQPLTQRLHGQSMQSRRTAQRSALRHTCLGPASARIDTSSVTLPKSSTRSSPEQSQGRTIQHHLRRDAPCRLIPNIIAKNRFALWTHDSWLPEFGRRSEHLNWPPSSSRPGHRFETSFQKGRRKRSNVMPVKFSRHLFTAATICESQNLTLPSRADAPDPAATQQVESTPLPLRCRCTDPVRKASSESGP